MASRWLSSLIGGTKPTTRIHAFGLCSQPCRTVLKPYRPDCTDAHTAAHYQKNSTPTHPVLPGLSSMKHPGDPQGVVSGYSCLAARIYPSPVKGKAKACGSLGSPRNNLPFPHSLYPTAMQPLYPEQGLCLYKWGKGGCLYKWDTRLGHTGRPAPVAEPRCDRSRVLSTSALPGRAKRRRRRMGNARRASPPLDGPAQAWRHLAAHPAARVARTRRSPLTGGG